MSATINEVAVKALVSISTVSRAFTAPESVRAATRDRVLEVARELGYSPNRAARGLITGKTGTIGIVVPDVGNPFFSAVLKGAHARAREGDYLLFLADTDEDERLEEDLVRAMTKQVDGVVLCSSRMSAAALDRVLSKPTVFLNRVDDRWPSVVMDCADGTRQAVEHLAALGHRRIAYLAGPAHSWSDAERLRGLRASAPAAGVTAMELGPFAPHFEAGLQAADLALAADVTAVLAYNDLMALGVLHRLVARGLRVPDDISVVGCDDIAMAAMATPPLTTVVLPKEAAGRAAVELLFEQLALTSTAADGVRQRLLPAQLLVRASTVPPSRGTAR